MTKQKEFETELLTLCDKYDIEADEMGKDFFNELWSYILSIPLEAEVDVKTAGKNKLINTDSKMFHHFNDKYPDEMKEFLDNDSRFSD